MAAYRADVESDLSAIHHLHDPTELDGPRMLRLAYRLGHYPGIVRNRVLGASKQQPTAPGKTTHTETGEEITWVPSTPAAIAASPLSRYFSTTTVGSTHER